jgi:DNA repair photolyase
MTSTWYDELSPKDRGLFSGLDEDAAWRFFKYLFAEPKTAGKPPSLRSSPAIGLYDAFCDRRRYPLGILWQSGPYACCSHMCTYCYGRCYLPDFERGGRAKADFRKNFDRCLQKMRDFKLPPRHLSVANSTDVLQAPLEHEHRHTLYLLERVLENRDRFSSVGVLTKNPGVLLEDPRYVYVLRELHAEVQVSIAFYRDDAALAVEPGAPLVSCRRKAVEDMVNHGVRVALRIDPLFPRGIPGCTEYQSLELDLARLVRWASDMGVQYIISSPLKLPKKGARDLDLVRNLEPAFSQVRGSYRRMPTDLQEILMNDLRRLCAESCVPLEHCLHNILKRNCISEKSFMRRGAPDDA